MSLTKPAGITGLDSAHPLFANIATFWEFGQLDKDLVTDTAITSTSTVVNDPDLGDGRRFDPGTNLVTNTLSVPDESTIVMAWKNLGTLGTGADGVMFLDLLTSPTALQYKQRGYYAHDVELVMETGNRGSQTNQFNTFGKDQAVYSGVHACAFAFTVGTPVYYLDGVEVLPNQVNTIGGAADINGAYDVPVLTSVGADGTIILAAIVVFDKVLNASELASVTSDPWAMVLSTAGPSFTIDDVILNPGDTITITTSNWGATDPTQAVITDSQSNTLTLPLTKTGTGTYTFTMPALPATGNTAPGLLFGTGYNVEVS
jgi:hypothetical protein